MRVFWRESKPGRHLMLEDDTGQLTRVGFILRTPRGFDAVAQSSHGSVSRRRCAHALHSRPSALAVPLRSSIFAQRVQGARRSQARHTASARSTGSRALRPHPGQARGLNSRV